MGFSFILFDGKCCLSTRASSELQNMLQGAWVIFLKALLFCHGWDVLRNLYALLQLHTPSFNLSFAIQEGGLGS